MHNSVGLDDCLTLAPRLLPPTRLDREASRVLARTVGARNRNCYWNAFQAQAHVPDALYVEGLVVPEEPGRCSVDEHAWLEQPDGTVLDPTPIYCAAKARTRAYVPQFRWSRFQAVVLIAEAERARGKARLPLRSLLPGWGQGDVTWRDGTLAAWRHVAALHERWFGTPRFYSGSEAEFLEAILGYDWTRPDWRE